MVSSLLVGAGLLAIVSGFVLFKLAERSKDKEFESHNALQILMFFLLLSSLFLVGKAAYDDRNYCDLVLTSIEEDYIYGNNFTGYHWDSYDGASVAPLQTDREAFLFHKNTSNTYDYVCVENTTSTGKWLYKIPLFIIQIAGIYLILYLLKMIYIAIKNYFGDKRNDDD